MVGPDIMRSDAVHALKEYIGAEDQTISLSKVRSVSISGKDVVLEMCHGQKITLAFNMDPYEWKDQEDVIYTLQNLLDELLNMGEKNYKEWEREQERVEYEPYITGV
jgi:hypothetical protein